MKNLRKLSAILIVAMIVAVFLALSPISSAAESVKEILTDANGEIDGGRVDATMDETETALPKDPMDETIDDPEEWEPYPLAWIYADGLTIATSDAELGGVQYFYRVHTSGEAFSSFAMELVMPYFVDVVEVIPTPELLGVSENGIFEYEISGNDVYVTFSSPYNFSDIPLFEIRFAVNDYSENLGWVECYGYQLVNEDVEMPEASFELGSIAIAPSVTMGDVDGDGDVDLADLLIIQRSIVSDRYWLDDQQFRAADIDKNGNIDMLDCQYIQNYLVGRIDDLESIGGGVAPDIPNIPDIPDIPGDPIDCNHEKTSVEETEATCTDWGYFRVVCEECGLIFRDTAIEAFGHDFVDGSCTRCGEGDKEGDSNEELAQLIDEAVANADETWNSLFDKGVTASTIAEYENQYFTIVERMCKSDSVETLEKCKQEFNVMINKILRTVEEPDDPTEPDCKHENNYTDGMGATCTEDGVIRYLCSDCGNILRTEYFAALGHDFVEGSCTRCGEGDKEDDSNAELAQLIDEAVANADETWNSLLDRGVTSSTLAIYKGQHFTIMSHMQKADSLETLELYQREFDAMIDEILRTVEPDVPTDPEIPTEPEECKHEKTWVETSEPSCTANSYQYIFCYDCKALVSEKLVGKAYGHDFVEGSCTRCGESEWGDVEEPEIPTDPEACKHKDTYPESFGATCAEEGLTRDVCRDCGEVVRVEYFTALGHDFVDGICTRCGESEVTELPQERVDLYSYSSKDLTIVLYSDYTSFYTRRVYTADGMAIKENGEDKWYEMEGRIYAFVAGEQYAFLVNEDGTLTLA